VQGEPRDGNGNRLECRPAADQPHGHAPMPPVHTPEPDNNQRANGRANANTDADAPPLFRQASQNLTVAAMLLRSCPEPATPRSDECASS
jgi:hypothetical protein